MGDLNAVDFMSVAHLNMLLHTCMRERNEHTHVQWQGQRVHAKSR